MSAARRQTTLCSRKRAPTGTQKTLYVHLQAHREHFPAEPIGTQRRIVAEIHPQREHFMYTYRHREQRRTPTENTLCSRHTPTARAGVDQVVLRVYKVGFKGI